MEKTRYKQDTRFTKIEEKKKSNAVSTCLGGKSNGLGIRKSTLGNSFILMSLILTSHNFKIGVEGIAQINFNVFSFCKILDSIFIL